MNQDISIRFKELTFVDTPLRMGGYLVDGWVNGWGHFKSLKILSILT